MAAADAYGLPVAIDIECASIHEKRPVERTIEKQFVSQPPGLIIGDKAYGSDPLNIRFHKL